MHGEQITAPSAAFDAAILITLLRGAMYLPSPLRPVYLLSTLDPTTQREAYNRALEACYTTAVISKRLAGIVQPWLLLALMCTPTDNPIEHARVTERLRSLCTSRSDALNALRCTAQLLCLPDRLCRYLRYPLFRWHYVYSLPNLFAALPHQATWLPSSTPACWRRLRRRLP